ncbi:hypothetical protein OG21DRAFT_360791 [Imleria badia]|nr:hypothetical protein OG21DRAFT_360791 [Imleria badia]
MKLATLAALTALLVGRVSAAPPNDVLTPSGIPATSGLPFSTLSFDTTAIPASSLSALSSLISSESTAITPPYTGTTPTATATATGASGTGTASATTSNTSSSTPTSTGTSGARSLRSAEGMWSEVVVGVVLVLGAAAALC